MEPRSLYPPPDSDWWSSEKGIRMCRRCGEDVMTHIVKDGWGERWYCQVCSHDWIPVTHPTWQEKPPKAGTTGE